MTNLQQRFGNSWGAARENDGIVEKDQNDADAEIPTKNDRNRKSDKIFIGPIFL